MVLDPTTNLELLLLEEGQASAEIKVNESMVRLDTLVQLSVIDRDLTVAPVSPAEGDTYLVASGATGEWATHDGELAIYIGGWKYLPVLPGWRIWIADELVLIMWNGTSYATINTATPGTVGTLELTEKSADPSAPPAGQSVIWQSDGTGSGNDGDIMITITDSGGTPKTGTVVLYSTLAIL